MDAVFGDQRYSAGEFVFGEAPNRFVTEVAPQITAGPVLCPAEGEGRNAVYLAGLGHQVAPLDQSEAGLDFLIARELERDVAEGDAHTGRGAVVQILARRQGCNFFAFPGSVEVYENAPDHPPLCRRIYPGQPVAGLFSQPLLALVYGLCRL